MTTDVARPRAVVALQTLSARAFFGAIVWLGLLHLIFGERLARMLRDWPDGLPGRPYLAHAAGALIALLALQLLVERRRVTAVLLGALLLLPVLAMHVPRALPTGAFGDAWLNVLKWLALAAGPLACATFLPASGHRLDGLARRAAATAPYLLGAFMIGSAVLHFRFASFVARLIPPFIPWPVFWTYFAGAALAAGGLGLMVARTRRLAALCSAAMIFSWFFLVHTPRMLAAPTSPVGWSEMAEALAFAALALFIALRSGRSFDGAGAPGTSRPERLVPDMPTRPALPAPDASWPRKRICNLPRPGGSVKHWPQHIVPARALRVITLGLAVALVACSAEYTMPQARVRHINPDGLHQNPAFSQVVVSEGSMRTIVVGGQNALDGSGEIVGRGDLAAQTEQAFRNLDLALAAGGASLEHIVKWNIYVVQGQPLEAGFAVFQRVWGERPNPPAITMLFVAGLANPDFLVEIDAIAMVPTP